MAKADGMSELARQVLGLAERMAPAADARLRELCALTVEAVGDGGNSCVGRGEAAGRTWRETLETLRGDGVEGDGAEGDGEAFPSAATLEALARATPELVDGDGSTGAPFVLAGGAMYTRRNYLYERYVEGRLREMASMPDWAEAAVAEGALGLDAGAQREAVGLMSRRGFSLLSGGPGTGKTYTVVRAMALALKATPDMRILLMAPTGKAADRLNESLADALSGLAHHPEWKTIAERIPTDAQTIHRALGGRDGQFAHGAGNPLACDWAIVDEASMVDLPLFARLLEALPKGCRLTLVGDPNQLASVERGRIFKDLCQMAQPGGGGMLDGCLASLTRSRRFGDDDAIGRLAGAILSGDAGKVRVALASGGAATRHRGPCGGGLGRNPGFARVVEEVFSGLAEAQTPAAALESMSKGRILCAMRTGPCGAEALNGVLSGMAFLRDAPKPWMVTANDHDLKLYNGNVGVSMPDQPDRVWFAGQTPGMLRSVHRALLPDLAPAWCLTVHKSQGSEYERVLLVLSDNPRARVLTRELFYTSVTRAKKRVDLWGSDEAIARCVGNPTRRRSGLGTHGAGPRQHG